MRKSKYYFRDYSTQCGNGSIIKYKEKVYVIVHSPLSNTRNIFNINDYIEWYPICELNWETKDVETLYCHQQN